MPGVDAQEETQEQLLESLRIGAEDMMMPDTTHRSRKNVRADFSAIPSSTLLGQLVRLPLRLLPKSAVVRILQGELRGARWIVGSGTHGNWLGSYEREKQLVFSSMLRPGQVVFDIGANVGFYSLLAARKVGPTGLVVAIEPLPENLAYLRQHISLNRCHIIQVEALAISDSPGVAVFATSQNRFMGHLADQQEGLKVQVSSLDELVSSGRLPAPDVIKVDVEGEEFKLLQGAASVVERYHPVAFLATHSLELHEQCIGLFLEWGYQIRPIPETAELLQATEFLAIYAA